MYITINFEYVKIDSLKYNSKTFDNSRNIKYNEKFDLYDSVTFDKIDIGSKLSKEHKYYYLNDEEYPKYKFIFCNNLEYIKECVSQGFDINIEIEYQRCLDTAIHKNNIDIIKFLF